MNSKKLLAVLCAASMASSTLVPVMSSAETADLSEATVLWSDTFDSYENYVYGVGNLSNVSTLAASTVGGEKYEGVPGATLQVCTRGGGDDSSYFLVEANEDGSSDKALKTTISRFSDASRGASIKFDEAYAPEGDDALVMAFKLKVDVIDENTYAPAFKIGDVVISKDMLGVENEWVDLKLAYYADGGYEVIIGDAVVSDPSATVTTASFDFNFSAIDATGASITAPAKCDAGYHTFWLDDIVIYKTADAYAAAPEAQTQTPGIIITPSPSPEPVGAPSAEIPAGAVKVLSENFNALDKVSYSLGLEGTDVTIGATRVTIGARSTGGDTTTYAQVKENVAGDMMLETANGKFGTSGRDVRIFVPNNVKVEDLAADGYAVMTFAAKLKPTETNPSIIRFVTNDDVVLATLTTDENSITDIAVPANEWIMVEFVMYSDSSCGVAVNGQETTLSAKVSALPNIRMHDGSGNATYTSVAYDNFDIYVTGEYIYTTPTPEPTIPPVEPIDDVEVDFTQDMNSVDPAHSNYFGATAIECSDIEGITYYIGSRADGANGDVTNVRIETDTYGNQYLMAQTDKYGANGRAPRIVVTKAPVLAELATDEDYVGMSFAAKLMPKGETPATLVFPMTSQFSAEGNKYVFNAGTLTTDETAEAGVVPANEWFIVDVIVKKTGEYEIFVDGASMIAGQTVGSATNADSSDKCTLEALPMITTNDCENATYTSFAIDNLVVYHTGEVTPLTTPEPTAVPEAAPAVMADADTTVVFGENFNAVEDSFTKMGTASADVAVGDNLNVAIGSRDENGSSGESSNDVQYTALTVKENVPSDKVLNLTGGKLGTVTRVPKVQIVDSPDVTAIDGGDDPFIAMGFAFKLNTVNNTDAASGITLIANTDDTVVLGEDGENTNSETKDDGNVYGYALTTITTETAKADEWHKAYVYVYQDYWCVEVDGATVAEGENVKYSGGDKVTLTKLPQIVAAANNTKGVVTYPNVDIDNLVVFTSEAPADVHAEFDSVSATEAVIAADGNVAAKVIVASYDADGRLVSATSQIANLVQGQNTVAISAAAGDEVMVWTAFTDSAMKPLGPSAKVQ